jgi:hypothetical protein
MQEHPKQTQMQFPVKHPKSTPMQCLSHHPLCISWWDKETLNPRFNLILRIQQLQTALKRSKTTTLESWSISNVCEKILLLNCGLSELGVFWGVAEKNI